jgi:hypothetical protein
MVNNCRRRYISIVLAHDAQRVSLQEQQTRFAPAMVVQVGVGVGGVFHGFRVFPYLCVLS